MDAEDARSRNGDRHRRLSSAGQGVHAGDVLKINKGGRRIKNMIKRSAPVQTGPHQRDPSRTRPPPRTSTAPLPPRIRRPVPRHSDTTVKLRLLPDRRSPRCSNPRRFSAVRGHSRFCVLLRRAKDSHPVLAVNGETRPVNASIQRQAPVLDRCADNLVIRGEGCGARHGIPVFRAAPSLF